MGLCFPVLRRRRQRPEHPLLKPLRGPGEYRGLDYDWISFQKSRSVRLGDCQETQQLVTHVQAMVPLDGNEILLTFSACLRDHPLPLLFATATRAPTAVEAQEIIDQWLDRCDFKIPRDHSGHPLNDWRHPQSPWRPLALECIRLLGQPDDDDKEGKKRCSISYTRQMEHGLLELKATIWFGCFDEISGWWDPEQVGRQGPIIVTLRTKSRTKRPWPPDWRRLIHLPRGMLMEFDMVNPRPYREVSVQTAQAAARVVLDYFSDKTSSL